MKAPISRFIQRARPYRLAVALACAFTAAVGVAWAQTRIDPSGVSVNGNVIGDDVLYSIGGGRAVSMGGAGNMQSIGVGVGWNSNLICGDMSITTTLQNQLNGITNGFQSIMSTVIQNATSAVASLPALIIQRADPGLYNLLTNGVLQARLDFDRSKMTCRAIANRMADVAGGEAGWDQLAEGMALRDAVSSTDAVEAETKSRRVTFELFMVLKVRLQHVRNCFADGADVVVIHGSNTNAPAADDIKTEFFAQSLDRFGRQAGVRKHSALVFDEAEIHLDAFFA